MAFNSICIWLYPGCLGYLVSGSWPFRQCWAWVSFCGMGKLGRSLFGNFHKFCIAIAPARLRGRTYCRSAKVLWLRQCPSPTAGILAWLQNMACSRGQYPHYQQSSLEPLSQLPISFYHARFLVLSFSLLIKSIVHYGLMPHFPDEECCS